MIIIFSRFIKGLLILSLRISSGLFLLSYPLLNFGLKIIRQPWLTGPIVQGISLALEPLKYLSQRLIQIEAMASAELGGPELLFLPAPVVKKDINKATVEELRGIEGVGFVRALEIVEYRDRFGDYRNIEELGLIRGVGSQTLRALRESYEVH